MTVECVREYFNLMGRIRKTVRDRWRSTEKVIRFTPRRYCPGKPLRTAFRRFKTNIVWAKLIFHLFFLRFFLGEKVGFCSAATVENRCGGQQLCWIYSKRQRKLHIKRTFIRFDRGRALHNIRSSFSWKNLSQVLRILKVQRSDGKIKLSFRG